VTVARGAQESLTDARRWRFFFIKRETVSPKTFIDIVKSEKKSTGMGSVQQLWQASLACLLLVSSAVGHVGLKYPKVT
jgi:hypothetical protein